MFMDTYDIFIYTVVALFILLAILILISLYLAIKEQKKCDKILKNSQERINYNNDYTNYYKGLYQATLQELNDLKKTYSVNTTSDKNNSFQSSSTQLSNTFNTLEDELDYYKKVYTHAINDIKIQTEQNSELRILVKELKQELTTLYDKIEKNNPVNSDLAPDSCEKISRKHHQKK
ncbi:hypothetical protein FDZ61_02175 [Ehrlichia ruminantium]|nr:hypothetical protein FDZ64_02160 [Ehrlichia ruminantium]QLK55979.1 hypothetical protein FDZ61_02175 [Ehrlichia ruminantium]